MCLPNLVGTTDGTSGLWETIDRQNTEMACATEGAKGESKDLEDCLGKDDVKVAKKEKLLEFVFELNGILEKKLVKNGPPSRIPAFPRASL